MTGESRSHRADSRRGALLCGVLIASLSCTHTSGGRSDDTIGTEGSTTAFRTPIEHRTLVLDDGSVLRYSLVQPRQFADGGKRVPLVLVLHYGAPNDVTPPFYGEEILERLVRPALGQLSAIFVAPDAPGLGWADPRSERAVLTLLNHLQDSMPVEAWVPGSESGRAPVLTA